MADLCRANAFASAGCSSSGIPGPGPSSVGDARRAVGVDLQPAFPGERVQVHVDAALVAQPQRADGASLREGFDLRSSLHDEFEHVTGEFLVEARAEAAQSSIQAGGSMPDLEYIPRRKGEIRE